MRNIFIGAMRKLLLLLHFFFIKQTFVPPFLRWFMKNLFITVKTINHTYLRRKKIIDHVLILSS